MPESSLIKYFFSEKIRIKNSYSNEEIKLYDFFHDITNIYPINIIMKRNFILFFVKNEEYFSAKAKINKLRLKLSMKKLILVRSEDNIINLLFSLFPDTYIHDIIINLDEAAEKIVFKIIFYFYKDRGIAVGRNGEYIKTVNELFKNCIRFKNLGKKTIEIKCEIKKK